MAPECQTRSISSGSVGGVLVVSLELGADAAELNRRICRSSRWSEPAPLAAAPEPPELDVRVTADVGPVVAWEGGALIGRFSTTGATLT